MTTREKLDAVYALVRVSGLADASRLFFSLDLTPHDLADSGDPESARISGFILGLIRNAKAMDLAPAEFLDNVYSLWTLKRDS